MIADRQRLGDGQLEFSRGVDTGRSPSRIDKNQLAGLVNATTRNDSIGQRPGWKQSLLRFDTGLQTVFQQGWFQRGIGYHPRSNSSPHLVLSISGRLFRVDVETWEVSEISFPGSNNPNQQRAWFVQFEEYVGWQDNQDIPLIYDGSSARRSDVLGEGGSIDGKPKKQLPVGNVMGYCNGRLVVALPDRRSFTIGDIVGGPSGAGSSGNRLAPSFFTENQFLNEVIGFTVPVGKGPITGITPIAQIDTSLGQGPALVVTSDGGFSLNLPTDRTTWLNVTYPIQTNSLIGNGFASHESLVLVNGDAWGRSLDGIRSYFTARRDFGMWANTPFSHEVSKYLEADGTMFLEWASGALHDNRLLQTCAPRLVPGRGVVFDGLVALDFSPITAIGKREPPAWDGLWIGVSAYQLIQLDINGVTHVYAVTLDNGEIGVWELTTDLRYDLLNTNQRRRITRAIEFPRYSFNNRLERKRLTGCDLWFDNIWGTVDGTLYHRPDQDSCWHPYNTFQLCAKVETCASDAVDGCVSNLNKQVQFRPRVGSPIPPSATEGSNNIPTDLGYEHQFRLELTGDCNLQSIRGHADRYAEEIYAPPAPLAADCTVTVACCPPNELALPMPIP